MELSSLAGFLVVATLIFSSSAGGQRIQSPTGPSTLDIIRARGFLSEVYIIKSHGYPLALYRIINPLADQRTLNKYPVLYGHGVVHDSSKMLGSSDHSRPRRPIIGQPSIKWPTPTDPIGDDSLPFMFSNNNFDVWLFDSRGSGFVTRNTTADFGIGETDKFWDFSMDDQALIDIPLLIDFVLTKTSSQKVVYVGYSESTWFMFALLSTAPEWADKIAAFVAMAPISYLSHIRGLTNPSLGLFATLVPEFVHTIVVPQAVLDVLDSIFNALCSGNGRICKPVINGIGGLGSGKSTPGFVTNFFHSTSLKALRHFAQLYTGKRFGMYDHGAIDNMRHYGQPNPPNYDLGRVRLDGIILVRGLADFLSTKQDQEQLIRELGTKPYRDIQIPKYNHFDFIDGQDIIRLVNGPVMNFIYELLYRDGPNILKSQVQPTINVPTSNILPDGAFSQLSPPNQQGNLIPDLLSLNPLKMLVQNFGAQAKV